MNEELTSNVKNVHQHTHPRPRSSSWSSPFSHSRSISLSILHPLSPERSRYNHTDQNNIEVQQATFETSDSPPNNDFSTNTTNYMRDNNIGKKSDIVPSKQIIVAQNLVHIRKYDHSKTKRMPNRENSKRNGHSQPTTKTITARSNQIITKYFNEISTTRERKNVQITEGKTNKKNIAI